MDAGDELVKALRHGSHDPGGIMTVSALRAFDTDSLPLGRSAFVVTSVSASLVRLDDGPGRYVEIAGAFTVAGGSVTGGTLSQVRLFEGSALSMQIVDVPGDPAALIHGLVARDPAEVEHVLFGGAGESWGTSFADTLTGFGGDDTLMGGEGNDFVRGLNDADYIDGGGGDDDLNGNLGADVVRGGSGADFVRGGQGDDYVFGGDGDDPHVNGNIGNDEVWGGAGRDTVFGGQGDDMLFGEDGADLLSGDLGADTLTGGSGDDRFAIRKGAGFDWVADFKIFEGDRIVVEGGAAFVVTTFDGQVVVDLGGGDRIGLAGVTSLEGLDWIVTA